MFMCVSCFGLVVSTCQVIGWKDFSEDTFMWWGFPQSPDGRDLLVCICFSFIWFAYIAMCFLPDLHNLYFIRLWHSV